MQFRIVRIPKGAGSYREICIPEPGERRRLRGLLPELEEILSKIDVSGVNYAFEKRKNCAMLALHHMGYRYTLSMDLKDFFDHVTSAQLAEVVPERLLGQCLVNGRAMQGLPTSPILSSIALSPCDSRILSALRQLRIEAVYTRYADDLIFSFDDRRNAQKIRVAVTQIVERFGFPVNKGKTRLQDSLNGRIVVTGIAVDCDGIYPTRRTKKRLRAATHQQNAASARGLFEWSQCRLPKAVIGMKPDEYEQATNGHRHADESASHRADT